MVHRPTTVDRLWCFVQRKCFYLMVGWGGRAGSEIRDVGNVLETRDMWVPIIYEQLNTWIINGVVYTGSGGVIYAVWGWLVQKELVT